MIEEILVRSQGAANPATLRVEPAQERSLARIDALLDAAATVVDDIGFDRLTTAHVAEMSGASIGTVYRYFPDRLALLSALRERAVLRYRLAVADELERRDSGTWQEAIDTLTTTFATMFRTEPGFRVIRFEDVRGVEEGTAAADHVHEFAERMAELLVTNYGFASGDDLVFRLDIATQMAETLIERAYLREPGGDPRMLAEAGIVAIAYLERYYG